MFGFQFFYEQFLQMSMTICNILKNIQFIKFKFIFCGARTTIASGIPSDPLFPLYRHHAKLDVITVSAKGHDHFTSN